MVVTSQDSLQDEDDHLSQKLPGSVMGMSRTRDCESQVRHLNHYTIKPPVIETREQVRYDRTDNSAGKRVLDLLKTF